MKRIVSLLLLLLLILPTAAATSQAETALSVSYTIPNDRDASRLTDAKVTTRLSVERGDRITLTVDTAGAGRNLYLEWYTLPDEARLRQYDAQRQLLSETAYASPTAYCEVQPLDDACTTVELYAVQAYTIATLLVTEGTIAEEYHWQTDAPTACDLLFVLPQPVTELENVGSLLVKYGVEHGAAVGIVYLCDGERSQFEEACDALWTLGMTASPILLHCSDHAFNDANDVHTQWAKNEPEAKLAAVLDALQPQVVVCLRSDDADARTAETSAVFKAALTRTTRQIPKVYELSDGGSTVVDCTEASYALEGRSAWEVATEAYRTMASRGVYRFTLADKPALSLLSSAVGADVDANDLFEHLDTASLLSYQTVTPTPSPTEVPTESPVPTEAPTEAPTATPTPIAATEPPKTTSGLFSCAGKAAAVVTEAPTEAPTDSPVPTEAPTEAPTAIPTETPTPEPTAEPLSDFDQHFVNDGGDEIVTIDLDKGEWIYRSDILAVEIQRYATTYPNGSKEKPCVYFVAHIYERTYDSFRPTFGSNRHNGVDICGAMEMADDAKCVLWITGDNLINCDTEQKGILIRGGYLFQRADRIDGCTLDPETHSLHILHKGSGTALDLLESGVQNCFSFGPVLVENGAIPDAARTARSKTNPRTAIGMIEPGHLVAVVADGRQDGYSLGLSGVELAELMQSLGCTTAYNLDGGVSATMIFMGNKINRHGVGMYNGVQSHARSMPDGLTWGYSTLYGAFRDLAEDNG